MILALHSLADIFTKIRYSWGQCPKKNTLTFGLPKLNLTLSIFVASCPNSGQGRGWDLGNAQKKRFFLGRRPLIENEKKAEVLTVSK